MVATIVVGYVPKPEGTAALERAIAEARIRQATVIVVSSHRGGDLFGDEDAVTSPTTSRRSARSSPTQVSTSTSARWSGG